jgi:L-seryl-tRNA(Ser) seleniumtransferase
VAKEEIVGLVAAVDWFLAQDDAAMEAEYRQRAERIAAQLKSIPTVQTQIFIPAVAANHVPHLLVTYDQSRLKITGAEVMDKMRKGTPRIRHGTPVRERAASEPACPEGATLSWWESG